MVRAGKDGKRKAERKGQERKKEEEQEGLKVREGVDRRREGIE